MFKCPLNCKIVNSEKCGKCLYCTEEIIFPKNIIIAKDQKSKKTGKIYKMYANVLSHDLEKFINDSKIKNFYEVIPEDLPRKVCFDIDGIAGEKGGDELFYWEQIGIISDLVKKEIENCIGKEVENFKIHILQSNGMTTDNVFKYSYHLICNYSLQNFEEWKYFCEKISDIYNKNHNPDNKKVIDCGFYIRNRNFRLKGCTKFGETRYLTGECKFLESVVSYVPNAIEFYCEIPEECKKIIQKTIFKNDNPESFEVVIKTYDSLPNYMWENYPNWRTILLGTRDFCRRNGIPYEEAFEKFDEYSKLKCPSHHDRIKNKEEWEKDDETRLGGIAFGTLVIIARKNDPNFFIPRMDKPADISQFPDVKELFYDFHYDLAKRNRTESLEIEDLRYFVKNTIFCITNGGNEYCLTKDVVDGDICYRKKNLYSFKLRKFWINNKNYDDKAKITAKNNPKKMVSLFDVIEYLAQDGNKYKYERFNPSNKKKPDAFNTFYGFRVTRIEKFYTYKPIILEHIKNILAPTPETFDYFINWHSMVVQKPEMKLPCLILFSEQEGIGKTAFYKFFGRMIGAEYTVIGDIRKVITKFNSKLEKNILCIFNEAKNNDTGHKEIEMFKSYITDVDQLVECKGEDSRSIENYSKFVLTTNNSRVIRISESDRRFAVIECSKKKKEGRKYFTELIASFEDDVNVSGFYHYLMNNDISNWDPEKMPESELKVDIQENCKPITQRFVEDEDFEELMEEHISIIKNKKVLRIKSQTFYNIFNNWKDDNGIKVNITKCSFSSKIKTYDGFLFKKSIKIEGKYVSGFYKLLD